MPFHAKRYYKRNALIVLTLLFVVVAAEAGLFFRAHMEGKQEFGKTNVRGGSFTDDGVKGKCFTGGGPGEIIVIPLRKPFPVEAGTFSLYFRVNQSAVLDKSIVLFDVLGTPHWWDRFSLSVTPKADGFLRVGASVGEAKQGRYADRPLGGGMKLSERPWHHLAFTWQNINTGQPDARFRIYLDGVLLSEKKDLELTMKNPAKEITLAGHSESAKRSSPGASGCISLDEVTVYDHVLTPSGIGRLADAKSVTGDFEDSSRCPVYRLPGKAPTIDGVFHPEEWSDTQTLGPFRDFVDVKGLLAEHQTRVNLAYDEKGKLYIGWQAFGASNPKGKADRHDAGLWSHDSLELFFSPDGKTVIQFIGNAYSSVYDEISKDGGATWNRDWNGAWEYKSSRGSGFWSGELVFDPVKLGLPPIQPGETWIFNACRNHFVPQKNQSVWHKTGNSFKDPKRMGRIRFYEQGLICNHIQIPEAVVGVDRMSLFLSNPFKLKARPQAALSFFPVTDTKPAEKGDVSTTSFDPGNAFGKHTFVYSVSKKGLHKALLTFGDVAAEEPAYSRPFYLDVKPPLQVEVTGNPCEGVLTARIKARHLDGKIAAGKINLLDKTGKSVFDQKTGPKQDQKISFSIKDVTPGEYTLSMVFQDASGKTLGERNLPLTIPARPTCIAKDAGMKNYTKPWGPMSLEGQTVKCWNREYVFENSIFPKKLISNGEDVLAGAIAFHYVTKDGKQGTLNQAVLQVAESTPEKVVFSVKGGDERISVAGTVRVEYDGLIIYDLTLTPHKKIDVKNFRLVFPLSAKSAKYIYDGTAYDATAEKNIISKPGFKHNWGYKHGLGVVSAERGLYWFSETDEGWRPYERDDVIRITRNPKDVRLVFNIMRDVDFSKPLKMKFGFMGTPVKPVNFRLDRQRVFHYWPGGPFKSEDMKNCYQRFDLKKAAQLGAKVVCPHEHWWKHYGGMEVANEESMKRFVTEAHELGMKVILYRNAMANPQEPSQRYFGDTWLRYPITGFNKYAGKIRPGADMGMVRCPNSPEYIDWYVGGCRELVRKYDIDGFYYDFGFSPCVNPKHGCGYVPEDGPGTKSRKGDATSILGVDVMEDSDVYGDRRATAPILGHRRLWQRMFNMIKEEKGEEGFINAHTDGHGAMHLSFVDTVWHSETSACRQKAGEFPTPEMYHIFYSKEVLGVPGEQIFRTNRDRPPSDAPKMLSISLLHREWFRPGSHGRWSRINPKECSDIVRIWKILADFGVDDATWHPYWQKPSSSTAIHVSPWGKDAALCSFWQKPTGLLAVVSNVSDKPRDVEVTLGDPAAKFKTVTDTRTGEKQKAAKTMTYHLEPHEFRLLRIE